MKRGTSAHPEAAEKRPCPEGGAFRSIGLPGILDAFRHAARLIARNRSPAVTHYDFLIQFKELIDEKKHSDFRIGSVRQGGADGDELGKTYQLLGAGGGE